MLRPPTDTPWLTVINLTRVKVPFVSPRVIVISPELLSVTTPGFLYVHLILASSAPNGVVDAWKVSSLEKDTPVLNKPPTALAA